MSSSSSSTPAPSLWQEAQQLAWSKDKLCIAAIVRRATAEDNVGDEAYVWEGRCSIAEFYRLTNFEVKINEMIDGLKAVPEMKFISIPLKMVDFMKLLIQLPADVQEAGITG
jgi:hypothetical protein